MSQFSQAHSWFCRSHTSLPVHEVSRIKSSLACRALQPCQLCEERADGTNFSAGCCEHKSVNLTSLRIQMKYPN
jgi:hypothetical protein